jgi:hypothetical protein
VTIPEQAGKVATSTVEALKSSPGLLVLVLLQLITLGVLAYVNENQNARRQERELLLLRSCANIHEEGRR